MSHRLADLVRHTPVVVTGMGTYTAAGQNVTQLWKTITSGHCPAVVAESPGSQAPSQIAICPARQIDPRTLPQRLRKMDRCVQLAQLAAMEAWQDAGLEGESADGVGIVVGSSRGPVEAILDASDNFDSSRMRPTAAANTTMAGLSGALSLEFRTTGPCMTISAACASGAGAIIQAAGQIITGTAERMLCGGTEAPLNAFILSQLQSAGILALHANPRQACRPFDLHRNGTVIGEGAAFLVLESEASARARGARIHAYLSGWGFCSAGTGRAGIEDSGSCLHRTMREALEVAGLAPGDVDYINTHGTGTIMNDRAESQAILQLEGGDRIPVSSTKPLTGHCMGAASAVEAVISILALKHELIPPSINCFDRDPACQIQVVTTSTPRKLKSVLSNSAGFWGKNAALLFQHR